MSLRLSARTCLAAGLVFLQTADLICTYFLLDGGDRGDVYEANPFARSILASAGWPGVAACRRWRRRYARRPGRCSRCARPICCSTALRC